MTTTCTPSDSDSVYRTTTFPPLPVLLPALPLASPDAARHYFTSSSPLLRSHCGGSRSRGFLGSRCLLGLLGGGIFGPDRRSRSCVLAPRAALSAGGDEGRPCLLRSRVARAAVAGRRRRAGGLFLEDIELYASPHGPLLFFQGRAFGFGTPPVHVCTKNPLLRTSVLLLALFDLHPF